VPTAPDASSNFLKFNTHEDWQVRTGWTIKSKPHNLLLADQTQQQICNNVITKGAIHHASNDALPRKTVVLKN